MQSSEREPSIEGPDLDEIRALVRRIIRSSTFTKSERLSTLLTYVCDLTLQGKAKDLNEQNIGTAVFGRAPEYDSSADGIVRTHASRLRNKLEQYFNDEGAGEALLVVIPRGGYVPYFEPKLPVRSKLLSEPWTDPASSIPVATPSAADLIPRNEIESHDRTQKSQPWLLFLTAGTLVVLILFLALRHRWARVSAASNNSTHHLWSQLFERGGHTEVVFGDSGLVMWHGATDHSLGLTEYIQGDYRSDSKVVGASGSLSTSDLSNRRYTSVVDVELIHALDEIAANHSSAVDVRFARDAHPNDFKHGDVILLGASEANPWVGMFEQHLNFIFAYDREHQVMSVVNRSPKAGEPARWDSAKQDDDHKVFGVVAFLPSLDGIGNVLLLEGTSMAGTESAWDFVSNEDQLRELLRKMGAGKGDVPHFEAVIGTNNFGGSASKSSILSWRNLDQK